MIAPDPVLVRLGLREAAKLIFLLKGSPDGVTQDMLVSQHGVPVNLLAALLHTGFVFVREEQMSMPRGLTRRRFFLTARGRLANV